MHRDPRAGAVLLALLFAFPTYAADPPPLPTVTVPKTLQADPGTLVVIPITTNGKEVKCATRDALLLPQFKPGTTTPYAFITVLPKPGRYCYHFYTAIGDVPSDPATCVITVGQPDPPVPPVPPTPPTPPTPPVPPTPPPIPQEGLRVLILYESAELSKLPAPQQLVLASQSVRDYLNGKCVVGADGKTREWRMWDKDVDASAESKVWQEALARPRKGVPWIIVSNGKDGFEGPLPASVDETLALLKKYGG